jgi:hypothetical protein
MAAMVCALPAVVACHKTFRGAASQPNPLSEPNEMLRSSESIRIVTGDMELRVPSPSISGAGLAATVRRQRVALNNTASFTVVSRDRLRFHVQIEHKWREWADIATWQASLIDDQGRRFRPEALRAARPSHLVSMWDYEARTPIRDRFGDVVTVLDDGYRRRKPLGSLSVFRGRGDVVFYARDIFTPQVRSMTLVIQRSGTTFAFTWRFSEDRPGERARARS